MDATTPTPSPREPDGRFGAGNPGGPGRPKGRRTTELRRAAEEAVTPDMVRGVLRKVAMQALQGNLAAARIFLERTLGRPAEIPAGEPLGIEPLKLRTAADCTAANQKVVDAMCRGELDVVSGKVLLDAIAGQAKLIETSDIEARLAELEQQAKSVDFRARGA